MVFKKSLGLVIGLFKNQPDRKEDKKRKCMCE